MPYGEGSTMYNSNSQFSPPSVFHSVFEFAGFPAPPNLQLPVDGAVDNGQLIQLVLLEPDRLRDDAIALTGFLELALQLLRASHQRLHLHDREAV